MHRRYEQKIKLYKADQKYAPIGHLLHEIPTYVALPLHVCTPVRMLKGQFQFFFSANDVGHGRLLFL